MNLTKQHILLTSIDILKTQKITNITITDICVASDIHKSTFYRYFVNKYDLLTTIIVYLINLEHEKTNNLTNQIIQFLYNNKSFLQHVSPLKQDNKNTFNTMEQILIDSIEQIINAEQNSNRLTPFIIEAKTDESIRYVLMGTIIGVLKYCHKRNFNVEVSQLQKMTQFI